MNKDSFLHAIAIIAAVACFFSSCSRQGNISVPASDPNILYMGRIHWSDTLTADFNYPGVTAMLNFNGTGLSMAAKPGSGQFMVEVDNDDAFKINFTDSISNIVLADSLPCGRHSARITYAIEGHEKQPSIHGFEIFGPDAKLLPAPERPALKIEFIGNSITCGYGTEADSGQVHFSYENENHTLSYAYMTARALDADFNVVAKSGIGMYRSYGGPREGTPGNRIPDLYDRTLFYTHDYEWDHSSFRPDIICINLGTNDTSLEMFEPELFEAKYNEFLDRLRELQPQARIVVLNGPMLNGHWLEVVTESLDRVAEGREGVSRFDFSPCTGELGYGADFHPSRARAVRMADELIPYLQSIL